MSENYNLTFEAESKLGQQQHCFSVQNLPKGDFAQNWSKDRQEDKNYGDMRLNKLKTMHGKSLESSIN